MNATLLLEGPDFGGRRAARLYQSARPFLRHVWAEQRPMKDLKVGTQIGRLLKISSLSLFPSLTHLFLLPYFCIGRDACLGLARTTHT